MRPRLASAGSLLALAAILAAAPTVASAQSFNASGTIVAGSGAIIEGAGSTLVATDSPNVVINWSPNDIASGGGPINFQSAGTSALFTNRDATSLTVLNRILPADVTRPITFNGTVTSQIVDLATGAASRGGTVFFYSPGGILVSATGFFDVGNLVLTTSDLNFDAATGAFGTAGTYRFLPANAGSFVEVQNGARISAASNNAYVALIAPKVTNSGTINVDGSAVIVAADASTITFRPNGLFDIQIDQGTSAAGEVVTNDGAITGPVGNANAVHRVYMVAVPRNDAITMAIKGGSTLGFDVAGAANVDGNAIVLSAGYNITNGLIDAVRAASSAAPATLAIGAINATSQLTGKATGQASLTVDSGNAGTFASNLSLSGAADPAAATDDGAFISVGGIGSTLDVTGDLQLTALDTGQISGSPTTDSGNAVITVDEGSLRVGGAATISSARAPFVSVDAQAGNATLTARGGAVVDIGSDLTLNASGTGKSFSFNSPTGPNKANGGIAQLSLEGEADVTVGRNLVLDASGTGGSALDDGFAGADGAGGQAIIEGRANGGGLAVTGVTTLDARGIGGAGQRCISCTVEGGTGTGGNASVIAGAATNFDFGNAVTVDATGQGGAAAIDAGKDGGAGVGGSAAVRSTGGAVTFAQTLDVLADGRGGAGATVNFAVSGATGSGGTGGAGTGGTASLAAGDATTLGGGGSMTVTGLTTVSAAGSGGDGGNGGTGTGGTAALTARNGSVNGAELTVQATGVGGAGANGGIGGAGTGGNADVISFAAVEGGATVGFGGTQVDARGSGGVGGTPFLLPDAGGAGGDGTGGRARVLAQAGNANLVLAGGTVSANGEGGIGGTGGSIVSGGPSGVGGAGGIGRGGAATLGVIAAPASGLPAGSATIGEAGVFANGLGGTGGAGGQGFVTATDGNGGNAVGGTATITAEAGVLNLDSTIVVQADATGGSSGTGAGGNAQVGGSADPGDLRGARLLIGTGRINGQAITLSANASGGTGVTNGTASILGHPLIWQINGGSLGADSLAFSTAGTAAAGAPASTIALKGGNSVLTDTLSFTTPADLTATLDGADVSADTVTISAGNWLPGVVPAGAAGTLSGRTSVSLTTGADLFAHLSASSGGALTLTAPGRVRLDDLTSLGAVGVTAGTTASLGAIRAGGDVTVSAPGVVGVGTITATGAASLTSGAALATGAVTAGQRVDLTGTSSVAVSGAIQSGDSVQLFSDGTVNAGAVSAGLVSPSALLGATYGITVRGLTGVTLGNLAAARDVIVLSPRTITTGSITGRDVAVLAGGAQSLGAITAPGRVLLADYEMFALGGNPLSDYDLEAVLTAAPVPARGSITVTGAINAGALRAVSLGAVSVRNVTTRRALPASGAITLQAGGALAAGALVADNRIDLTSGTTMDVTSAATGDALALNATGALTGGNLTGGTSVTVTGGAAVTAGAVASNGAVGLTTGGGLTLTGPASAATFTATVAGDASTQGIIATGSILVDAVGTVRLGGVWQSPSIEVRANDLDMPAGSGLNAGVAGTIALVSRNAAGMRIGDGLDGSVVPAGSFTIDNAEWSRINSGSVSVFARDVAGPIDLLIGKLDMTGPDAGSTIDDPLGTVQFTTGGAVAGAPSGTIRVAGALRAIGFRSTNALVFRTGQFQIAADTGSLTMLGTGDVAAGTLRINARDIHVAATPLLAQLAADPFFAGVEPALDRVSAGGTGPVLRAGALDFTVGRSFYIQRTGNGFDPLGFEEPLDGFKVAQAGPDPIAVIINGTFRTVTGLVSGAQAWRQFKNSGFDFSGFTADSRLNGCLLTAVSCGLDARQLPDPGIRTVIEGVGKPRIGDTPRDPDERKTPSGNAILPKPLLLPVQPDALPGEVDEPIAGSGNPALAGGSAPEGVRP